MNKNDKSRFRPFEKKIMVNNKKEDEMDKVVNMTLWHGSATTNSEK